MLGAEECGASAAFVEQLGKWLATLQNQYAPFVCEETGVLDWMDESPPP